MHGVVCILFFFGQGVSEGVRVIAQNPFSSSALPQAARWHAQMGMFVTIHPFFIHSSSSTSLNPLSHPPD